MKKNLCILSLALIVLNFVACKKDASVTPAADITGNYSLESANVATSSDVSYTLDGTTYRAVTTSAYSPTNVTGDFVITSDQISYTDFSYTVNTTAHTDSYENGTLQDQFDLPFSYTLPSSSASANYKYISSDSIYFTSGTFVTSGGSQQNTNSTGAKISVNGDVVTLISGGTQTVNQTTDGITITSINSATETLVLKKK